jgi:hypothetical protein
MRGIYQKTRGLFQPKLVFLKICMRKKGFSLITIVSRLMLSPICNDNVIREEAVVKDFKGVSVYELQL